MGKIKLLKYIASFPRKQQQILLISFTCSCNFFLLLMLHCVVGIFWCKTFFFLSQRPKLVVKLKNLGPNCDWWRNCKTEALNHASGENPIYPTAIDIIWKAPNGQIRSPIEWDKSLTHSPQGIECLLFCILVFFLVSIGKDNGDFKGFIYFGISQKI